MGAHLIDGQFQSDKYPTTPRGKVPLSVTDPTAQPLLWEYAQQRRAVDAEFSADLEAALIAAGYGHVPGQCLREHTPCASQKALMEHLTGQIEQVKELESALVRWYRYGGEDELKTMAERILATKKG